MNTPVTITDEQITALALAVGLLELNGDAKPELKDLLRKLQFAQDNKLRLSGRMRVIEIERKEENPWRGVYPGMCVNPEICKGKTHCPRDYSCCE